MKKVCGDTLEKWEGANYKACAMILNDYTNKCRWRKNVYIFS